MKTRKSKVDDYTLDANYEYKYVEIMLEVKDPVIDGFIIDEKLRLNLIIGENPYFEGYFRGQKITIPFPKGWHMHRYFNVEDIEEYLPSCIVQLSKRRITEGIDKLLDKLYS